ncbi:CBS domain-containing protein [Francisella adeliensis]|uniref:CBS domain-containing protein n=1 Tax=Francisella adeliensis TaxID=2007306 RepID=A0A2Z4XYC8_9GAMM|nr:CBS domain-containing protein [Francisella adeliensis]AXA33907.1 hypothetical protein CDH04_05505 [Francisella adeliensis]MBK2085811.1 CBS domain-containing protein [Francisella adeliensis]MBK2097689.1 CBS domain-containing protein [Francisella adeliensis]QIW12143.1 CBS domain-containing protein [Francisella adeliensis]QIW14017.1 CBS domain-containing protein [Francisella adeliensis]
MELKEFKLLELSHFDNVKSIEYLTNDAATLLYLDDPALKIFRDYKKHKALTVPADMPIADVKKKLISNFKDLALVTNTDNKVVGTIALHYLEGRAILKRAADEGFKMSDMVANDAKINLAQMNTISYPIVEGAKIGHILNTLINSDRHHIIVYDEDNKGNKFIRGYFSLAFIRRNLGLDIKHLMPKNGLTRLSEDL